MTWFLLTPESIFALVSLILAAVITLYLLRVPQKTRATWFLAGAFLIITAGFFVHLLWTCIAGPGSPVAAGYLVALAAAFLPVFFVPFIQFAYAFHHNPYPREARAVLLVSGVLALAAILGLYDIVSFHFFSLSLLLLTAWPLLVFLRKTVWLSRREQPAQEDTPPPSVWAHLLKPSGRAARAQRAFALLLTLFLIFAIAMGLSAAGVIPMETRILLISLFHPFFLFGFITVYVNYAPEPTTFQVKLVGLTLATTLTLLSLAALVVLEDHERVRDFIGRALPMPERQTLQFEPTSDGGYRVAAIPFQLEDDPGRHLPIDRMGDIELVELDFTFPLHGSAWNELYVYGTGVVTFGGHVSNLYAVWTTDFPKIITMAVAVEKAEVHIKQNPGRATFTWRIVPYRGPSETNTAQLTLYESGAFTFSYIYKQAPVFMRGIHPGGANPPVKEVVFDEAVPLTVPAGTVLIEDTYLPSRRIVHERMAGLFWLVLGSTLFILVVFPLSFRAILTRPLDRLLGGMRRVNEGTLDAEVPVTIKDEIGRLARHFNQMTQSLREADAELRAYAEELEQRVEERTAALEAQNTELEAQRTRLAQQAERLRELDAVKARFFANISHEFRTPLTLLLGPLQDAMQDGDVDRLRAHLPLMQRNAERLLALIGQLLDLSKLEAGGMQLHARKVDLVPFLRQLTSAFTSRAEHEGLTLVFEAGVEALPCYADADKLEKVVLNLLSNALKFTDPGSKVRVRLAERRGEAGSWAEIAVQDTGRGIPAGELPRIFDRFHQVESGPADPHEGTGIGLALAQELVELHGGTITVESTEGFGSVFTVRLPLGRDHLQESDLAQGPDAAPLVDEPTLLLEADAVGDGKAATDAEAPEVVEAPDLQSQGEGPTVLVVEDNADMRAYLRSHLAEHYRVAEAVDGAAGLEAARRLEPDLIISDVMMPNMDGYAFCQSVKIDPALEHVPVVLLTARADEASRIEGLDAGADAYLAKPFGAEELLVRVENLIELRRRLRTHFGGEVVVGASQVVVPSAEAAFMKEVRDVVEAHLSDTHFGVDQLAAEVGLSARQLLRRIKEAARVTPSGYIRMLRLERAAQLLEQRTGTVSEVAYRVGFNQAEYFSRVFRQVFGVPPSEYTSDPP